MAALVQRPFKCLISIFMLHNFKVLVMSHKKSINFEWEAYSKVGQYITYENRSLFIMPNIGRVLIKSNR